MRKINEISLFANYSNLTKKRLINSNTRTNIHNKLIASLKGKDFYDGKRKYGFGGYKYDGRWKKIAEILIKKYKLNNKSKILQINCDKGFLIYELKKILPKAKIIGIDRSKYSINNSKKKIRHLIKYYKGPYLKFKSKSFDAVIAIGYIYEFALFQIITALKEIHRVSNSNYNYITLGSYNKISDLNLLKKWSLLGTTILKRKEWKYVLKFCNYKGDYEFITAKSLNLSVAKK
jgi:ubiquinone/menaquinone biosynthesis C-methylase UbiE